MGEKTRYRLINTAITASGALACIISGFIPAPEGMLPEGRISIIQVLASSEKTGLFVLASLLLVTSVVLAATGKLRAVALIAALAGACLFALIDISIVTNYRAFEGTLLIEAGIVLAVSGALLHAIGTPREKVKKREPKLKADNRVIQAKKPKQTDYAESFYRSADETAVTSAERKNTEDFGEYLAAALRAITEEDDKPSVKETGRDESAENGSLWTSGSELEELLKENIRQSEAQSSAAEYEVPEATGDVEFYANLEDMLRSQK